MPSGETAATGRAGEDLACRYLERQGCVILERNWRGGRGEVDIIARCPASRGAEASELGFVEVRTRHGRLGLAEESISRRKAASMAAAAFAYMEAQGIDPETAAWRIDLVAVAMLGGENASVNWIQGVLGEDALPPG